MENEYILEMLNISKSFPGVKALNKINFKVKKGVVHAIVGENGAGKSTLMKILNGMFIAEEGEIILRGKKVKIRNQKDAFNMGLSMIYQELNPVLEMTIAENIFLGAEPKGKIKGFVDFHKLFEEADKVLKSLDLRYDSKMKMKYLSVSDMQMIEIAKAITRNASIIVMDEPTSAISEKEVAALFSFIKRLKEQGVTIIYISHRLEELSQIVDYVTVLRDGNCIDTKPMKSLTKEEIIKMMVGREISTVFPKSNAKIGDTILEVDSLTRGKYFKDISFSLKKGEILGIAGLMGAGRTEVARAIFGLDKIESGTVKLEGKKLKIRNPVDAIKNHITMVSEDRKRFGLILCRPVFENISLAFLKRFSKKFFIDKKQESEEVLDKFKDLSIKAAGIKTETYSLSGGNQQKVVLAKWLIEKPKVLIMDEPTRGIDVKSKQEIYRLICKMANNGIAVIMISSELPEIIGMCDRVIVMAKGTIKGIVEKEDICSEKIMNLAAGV